MKTPQVTEMLTRHDGLATRLRTARGEMPAKKLAENLNWHQSKISRIEGGKQLPTSEELALWAAVTEAGEAQLEQWRAMLAEAQQLRSTFDRRFRDGQQPVQSAYNQLIESCTTFRFAEMVWIPRFLQTPDYTRAVLQLMHGKYGSVDDVAEAVATRQASVRFLYEPGRRFEFILHESILRSGWPTAEIMQGQLTLLQAAIGLPNVRLGIYPLDVAVGQPMTGSFELYGDTCYVDIVIDDEKRTLADEVAKFNREMDVLWESAVEGDRARALINDALQRQRRT
ncbi:helix-turn-helix domain-containing protein [Krasilnikovia sp. MM14-A1259]|uniref:helix-turn-helix domain-containing protein n=1 Tax=Krasilnikovia sp. MM14-A1259 TaxID=3373539 RepID=UPI00382EC2BB